MADSAPFQLRIPVPASEVLAVSVEGWRGRVGFSGGSSDSRVHELDFYVPVPVWGGWGSSNVGCVLVAVVLWNVWVHFVRWLSRGLDWFLFQSIF